MRIKIAWFSILLLGLLLVPVVAFAAEPQPLQLFLDGKLLTAEVAPRINKDNKVIVPVRIIAESLGSKVQWDAKTRKVTVNKANVSIELVIDKREVIVNGKPAQLDTAPSIVDGNTMLPVRFISEQFGIKVTWDALTQSVFLFKQESDNKVAAAVLPPSPDNNSSNGKPDDKASDKPAPKPTDKQADKATNQPADKATTAARDEGKRVDSFSDKLSVVQSTKPALTEIGTKPTPVFSNQPFDYTISSTEAGGKKPEAVTVIHSISLEGDQFILKTSGAKANPDVTTSPNRVQIDIPGAQLASGLKLNANGEGIAADKNAVVSQIRYLLFSKESSIVRIIIDLNKKIEFKASANNSTSQLVWLLQPAKERYTVVIDSGHGGKDTGAVSVTGRHEKQFALGIGAKVLSLLAKEPKIEAIPTRKNDTFVELPGRVSIANDMKADLFVSIHGNSTAKEEIDGIETYYSTEQSLAFATLMHHRLLKATEFEDRKVKQSDFYVIKNTNMPSILLELGFLSNKAQEQTMFQEAFQNQVAQAIVAGIKQQLKLEQGVNSDAKQTT